jgi:hypothetical protein
MQRYELQASRSAARHLVPRLALVGAGVAIVLIVPQAMDNRSPEDSTAATESASPGTALQERILAAFEPLGLELAEILQASTTSDTSGVTAYQSLLNAARAQADAIPGELATIEMPSDVAALYNASVSLYVGFLSTSEAVLRLPDGALATQMSSLGTRLRTLADRIFDQGRDRLIGRPGPDSPGEDIVLVEPVPSWSELDVVPSWPLAGPQGPLAPRAPRADSATSDSDWASRVSALDLPTPRQLSAVLSSRSEDGLRSIAAAFERAEAEVAALPVPTTAHRATTLRLSLLVSAEASRVTVAGTMTTGDDQALLTALGASLATEAASLQRLATT